jgi:ribulose-bisphosphate carboxylase large chain
VERIRAKYWIETAFPLQEAADALAGEQSSGTFIAVPNESVELKARAAAVVESITPLDEVTTPSLPGASVPKAAGSPIWKRAVIEVSWPLGNMGPSLPNLLSTVAGNLFELAQFSGLRLLDLELPSAFASAYPGPAFGITGTRTLSGVRRGPLIGTIVKPSVGLSPTDTAELVKSLAEAGIDFIKDDELQANGPHCPFDERVRAVMDVLNAHADRTGRKVMYAFNLTGEVDEMRRRHDVVRDSGGACVMASMHSIGLSAFSALRRDAQLPIHAHRNGWGIFARSPHIGIDYTAWQKLWRLAGADHMHVNGIANKFSESDDSVIASARACHVPLFDELPCLAMPVFSSGQSAVQANSTFAALGNADLIYCCGGGIIGHPDGIEAGVRSVREAWEAAEGGMSAKDYARNRPALARALEVFGR